MTSARFIVGDSLTVLRTLPDASVDLVMSSPPFLALRSYLPADHPDKALEIGSEATPGEFLDVLLDIVVECRRVLAPHGSLVFELGDTYSGSGGAGGDYNEGGLREGAPAFGGSGLASRGGRTSRPDDLAAGLTHPRRRPGPEGRDRVPGWPLAKCLTLIPQSFAWALAYGRNPFTGREIEPWRVRNVVAWCRPNPPVGALGDKFRPATSYLTVACVSGKRYFDLDAVRGNPEDVQDQRRRTTNGLKNREGDGAEVMTANYTERIPSHPNGAPPLDYWVIPTQPYAGSHYATFPTALVVRPVKAMCPQRVCRTCGVPSTRITERSERYAAAREAIGDFNERGRDGKGVSGSRSVLSEAAGADITSAENITVGWSDCGHNDWRSGVVLDPFAGSGTTLEVATGHGRDAIGIDLDERNAELALQRVGPLLLTVEQLETSPE